LVSQHCLSTGGLRTALGDGGLSFIDSGYSKAVSLPTGHHMKTPKKTKRARKRKQVRRVWLSSVAETWSKGNLAQTLDVRQTSALESSEGLRLVIIAEFGTKLP
jgi:hypothetical protein